APRGGVASAARGGGGGGGGGRSAAPPARGAAPADTTSPQRSRLRQRYLVQPLVPVEPTAEPSSPIETLFTPGKVTAPHELPCAETMPIDPDGPISAYALPARIGTMSVAVPSQAGGARNAASPGWTAPAQAPSTCTATPPSSNGRSATADPVPIENGCPEVFLTTSTHKPLRAFPLPLAVTARMAPLASSATAR